MSVQSPCQKIKATLLQDVRIWQELYYNHFGTGNSPIYPLVNGTGDTDQSTVSAVG